MIYLIADKTNNLCKMGFSNDPKKRLAALQTSNPFDLSLEVVLDIPNPAEKIIHKKFNRYRVRGEWFTYCKKIKNFFFNFESIISEDEVLKDKIYNHKDLNPFLSEKKPIGVIVTTDTVELKVLDECSVTTTTSEKEIPGCSFYENNDIAKLLFEVGNKTRDLFLYIQLNLGFEKEVIELHYKHVCKETNMGTNSYYAALKELEEIGIISKKNLSEFWINPLYLFKGDRLSFYTKNYNIKTTVVETQNLGTKKVKWV